MRLVLVVVLLLLAQPGGAAYAHPGEPPAPHDLWQAWNWDPLILAGLALTGWAYRRGLGALWQRAGRGRGVAVWRAACFYAGLLFLGVALISPVDTLGGVLFSAHMLQHLLLILAAAPLLALGAPQAALAWALPHAARPAFGRWLARRPSLPAALSFFTRPPVAWMLHLAALLYWHLPGPYQAAVEWEAAHALEHASFLGTGLLFWYAVARAGRPGGMSYPGAAFFVFTTAMVSGVLGALITFSTRVWYPVYAATTLPWGRTALEDQQLAGTLMWVPANLVYLAAILLLLWRGLDALERREQPAAARRVGSTGSPLLAFALLAGALFLSACSGDGGSSGGSLPAGLASQPGALARSAEMTGGDPDLGRQLIRDYGCHSCHAIPGIRGTKSYIGPPLDFWANRGFIAGALPNTGENLVLWIQYPQSVEPGTAMPDLGVSKEDAGHIAAYLFTLRR